MKISKVDLIRLNEDRYEAFEIDYLPFENNPYLKALKDVEVDIVIYRDYSDRLKTEVKTSGIMVCPCAITLEDVEVDFDLEEEVILSFEDEDDVYFVDKELDLKELILSFILPEVPIKVVKNEKIEYPNGDGWRVMTEDAFLESKAEAIDPRWEKLKEYQWDEEE